jgi:hypothetical protein
VAEVWPEPERVGRGLSDHHGVVVTLAIGGTTSRGSAFAPSHAADAEPSERVDASGISSRPALAARDAEAVGLPGSRDVAQS